MAHATKRARTDQQAGDMRKPIRILTRTDAVDASGGATAVYTDLFGEAVWTQDEHKKSITRDAAGHLFAATYHIYTLRFNDVIQPGMYLQDPDYPAPLYIQGTTDPDGTRHWLQLSVEDLHG